MVPKGTLASGRNHEAESGRVPGVLVSWWPRSSGSTLIRMLAIIWPAESGCDEAFGDFRGARKECVGVESLAGECVDELLQGLRWVGAVGLPGVGGQDGAVVADRTDELREAGCVAVGLVKQL